MSNILKKIKKEHIIYGILLLVFSVGFVSFFSAATSPFFKSSSVDSDMFQLIGKCWSEGYLPYKDIWDSKGPFIFWIDAMGFMLTGTKVGIYILQIAFMFVSVVFMFKIFRLGFSNKISILLTVSSLVLLITTYLSGNMTEEYALPFLTISFYFLTKWAININEEPEHNYKHTILYGICFGVCLFSRVTNAVGLCVGIAFVVIFLIVKGKWKNLGLNAISFIVGFCVVALPFVIYFAVNGILDEMWYGTLLYNFGYAGESKFIIQPRTLDMLFIGLLGYGLIIVGILVVIFYKKNRLFGIMLVAISCVSYIWFSSSFEFQHYYMIELPYFAIMMVSIKLLFDEFKKADKKIAKNSLIVFSVAFILFGSVGTVQLVKDKMMNFYYYNYLVPVKGQIIDKDDWSDLIEKLPKDYKNSFVAYNCYPKIYLEEDIKPACRFFVLQDFASSCNENLIPKVVKSFDEANVKWILVLKTNRYFVIQDMINEKYEVYDKKTCADGNEYVLYKLKT